MVSIGGLAALAVLATGCALDPEAGSVVAQPKTPAVKNITSFTPALKCMDNLFASYGKRDIIITSAGLPDATGKITAGTKDMMISTISKMSIKSRAFRFVDFDPNQVDVERLHSLIGITDQFMIPNYYIRGAITQLDAGVASDRIGGGIAMANLALGINKDQMVSMASMDLNIGDMVSRQILPGMNATNSIAIVRRGQGADVDAKIGKVGVFFNMSMDRSEGTHASIRTLVELSLIEVLGKLAQVPYWKCLEIPQTNPQMQSQARDWYDTMKPKERVLLVQRSLIGGGYMGGRPTGRVDRSTRTAIGRYQAENQLIANGRITFDLYYSLLGQKLVLASYSPPGGKGKKGVIRKKINLSPVKLSLSSNKGAKPVYRVGEKLVVKVNLKEGAHVYCYYQDAGKTVARIFPNRFSPDSYIAPREKISIPDEYSSFELVMEKPGNAERIDCLASRREVGLSLPRELQIDDLTPIRGKTMKDIVAIYRKIDRVGLGHKKMAIRVTR